MEEYAKFLDLLLSVGWKWAPPVIAGLVMYLLARHRWATGSRSLREIFVNRQFIVGVVVCSISLITYYSCAFAYRRWLWGLPPPFEKDEIGILIAKVPADAQQQKQALYAQAIRALVEKSPDLQDVVKVRLLQRPLPVEPEDQQVEAVRLGRMVRAAFVVRPYELHDTQAPWLSIIDQPYFSRAESRLGNFSDTALVYPDELSLPGDMALLARCTLALAFLNRKLYDKGVTEIQTVLDSPKLPEAAPTRADLNMELGIAFLNLEHTDKAVDAFRRVTMLAPDNAKGHGALGVALDALGSHDDALAELKKGVALDSNDVQLHYDLYNVLGSVGQYEEAVTECQSAVAHGPDDASARLDLATALYNEARRKNSLGQNAEATKLKDESIRESTEAARLNAKDPWAHFNMGVVYDSNGNFGSAIPEYRMAIERKSDFSDAHLNLGNDLYGFTSDLDAAAKEIKLAIRINPNSVMAHTSLCGVLLKQKRTDEAITECRKALAINPKDVGALVNLGNALVANNLYAQAVPEYKSAISLQPGLAAAHSNLGIALLGLGRRREAKEQFSEAHRLDPSYVYRPK